METKLTEKHVAGHVYSAMRPGRRPGRCDCDCCPRLVGPNTRRGPGGSDEVFQMSPTSGRCGAGCGDDG